jgi:NADH-quinone oxidoreductase subunit N
MSLDALSAAQRTLTVLLPELLILAAAVAMMTAGAFVRARRRAWSLSSAAVLVASIVALIVLRRYGTEPIAYASVALNDALSFYARLGLLVAGLIILALAHDQVDDARSAEFFGALLMIQAGAMLVATANELIFLFAGLELVSLPTYLLLYLSRRNVKTQEAATKYFYLSIFSSGILLFGMAYLYGLTGVSNLKALAFVLRAAPSTAPLAFGLIAVLFIMGGLSFRVAAVPFHFYAPDVYQGSPTVIAAMLSWVPKAIGFLAMIRMLTAVVGGASVLGGKALILAWIIAVATMTLGNTVALIQDDLKRLLGYSSIAHAGYLMIGVTAAFAPETADAPSLGVQGIVFYLAAYALMTLGVFGAMLALDSPERPVEAVDDLAGLNRTHPLSALALALCLFSLAGVPLMLGFWGKFQIFTAALSLASGESARLLQLLTVIGVINAAIGAYYYLRIVVVMYLRAPLGPPVAPRAGWPTVLAVGACAALSLILGIFPEPLNRAARESAIAAGALPDPVRLEATQTVARPMIGD